MFEQAPAVTESEIAPWLGGRAFADWRAEFDAEGFVIFENVLAQEKVEAVRAAIVPHMIRAGRNDFEGLKTHRVYALLAKSPLFAELIAHPLALAFVEAELGASALLSACLAISLEPGETAQPWHFDDSHIRIPRPRPAYGVSTFWAVDPMTEDNGATEIIPGSHLWPEDEIPASVNEASFTDRRLRESGEADSGARADAVKAIMPAGALMVAKGTLWHRGGANRSGGPRLIVTPQYCPGWARGLENMSLAAPPEKAKDLPPRARELLGYSIHPPFMGYVDGVHPAKLLR